MALGIETDPVDQIKCPSCSLQMNVTNQEVFEEFLCPDCKTTLTRPARLGNFMLIGKLGAGGMGAVFLAVDETLGRDVAIKVIRKEFGNDPKFYEQFRKEAQATAQLNHINVVQIYSFGQEKGQPYIVTELVTGGSLNDFMEDGAAVDEKLVLNLASDIAHGLQAAQDAGLTHGDIKPDNIMFDGDGRAKIMDFGLANFQGGATEPGKKKEVWGTPYYIAPEKAKKKIENYRSDQYSLGATLFHALAGEPPFEGETPTDVVLARLDVEPPDVRKENRKVHSKTASIIKRMMALSPSHRYPTYSSMQSDIEAALLQADEPIAAASTGSRGASSKSNTSSSKKGFPILPVGIGVGVLALVGVLAAVFMGGDDQPKAPKASATASATSSGTGSAKSPAVAKRSTVDPTTKEPSIITKSKKTMEFPFASSEQRKLRDAMNSFADQRVSQGNNELNQLIGDYDPASLSDVWATFYQGVAKEIFDGAGKGKAQFDRVIQSTARAPQGLSPKNLAKVFLDSNAASSVMAKAKQQKLASWYPRLSSAIVGVKAIQKNEPNVIKQLVRPLAASSYTQPEWCYAFSPVAAKLYKEAEKIEAGIKGLDANKDRARAQLVVLKNTSAAIWAPYFDNKLKAYSAPKSAASKPASKPAPKPPAKAVAKPSPKPKAAQPNAMALQDADMDMIRTRRMKAKDSLKKKDFTDATKKFTDQLEGKLKSAKGKQVYEATNDAYSELQTLPIFIADTLKKKPIPYQIGKVKGQLRVNDKGLVILKDSKVGAEIANPFASMPAKEYAKLIGGLAGMSSLSTKQKAQQAFALAVYANDVGDTNLSKSLQNGAVKLDPSLQKKVDLLFNLL